MSSRVFVASAALLLLGMLGPAGAVVGTPPTCTPDGRFVVCQEYEVMPGGQRRCVKCGPRLGNRPPRLPAYCRFRPNLPQCQRPSQYFTPDGRPIR